MARILLVDNGSKRADATRSLHALAARLQARCGCLIEPVSLLHSDSLPAAAFNGREPRTLAPYLQGALHEGAREFLILPLFFGQSRALSGHVPQIVERLRAEFGPFDLDIAEPLCPLPQGEARLVNMLEDCLASSRAQAEVPPSHVILVDHGSPDARVTAVRNWLARELAERIRAWAGLSEAAMERRAGPDYDFNGPLLADALHTYACAHPEGSVLLAMQFLAAGRHAGPDGDVARICQEIQQRHPGFRIGLSALLGTHPLLVDILHDRLRAALARTKSAGLS